MSLTPRQEKQLDQIVILIRKFQSEVSAVSTKKRKGVRKRRTGSELEKMRKEIIAARTKGGSAAKLAEKYGVSIPYIYMITK
jgi:hypothetical protein